MKKKKKGLDPSIAAVFKPKGGGAVLSGYVPSFSIIMPTYGDFEGLGRTLQNLILQREGPKFPTEVLVIGDGFEEGAQKIVQMAQGYMAEVGRTGLTIMYSHLNTHSGTGNFPRRLGIKEAKNDWVLFIDAGTACCADLIVTLGEGLSDNAQAKIVTWDMVQLLEPVPYTTSSLALTKIERKDGLPYILPGCSTAVRREFAQQVEWPNVGPSDWAYFSDIWKLAFGEPEDTDRVNKEVLMIPWVLTVAYGARTERKLRWPISADEFVSNGYCKGFTQASSTLVTPQAEDILRIGDTPNGAELGTD